MSLPCPIGSRFSEKLAVVQSSVASVGSTILRTDHCINHCVASLFLKTAKTDAKVSKYHLAMLVDDS